MNWPAFFGKLASDVAHIHTIVSDIRADLRNTDRQIDSIHDRLDLIRDRMMVTAVDVTKRVEEIRAELAKRLPEVSSWQK